MYIDHDNIGDIYADMSFGERGISLLTNNGGSTDNFGSDDEFMVLSDDGADIDDYPAGSSFKPASMTFFWTFGNYQPYGEWWLNVRDTANPEFQGNVVNFTCNVYTSKTPNHGCGNGVLDDDETCDDGTRDYRGCNSMCTGQ